MFQKLQDNRAVLLSAVAIFAIGLTTSGYALGDGLRRSKMAEHRIVSVRGVSERNVTADLATWTVDFSHQGTDFGSIDVRLADVSTPRVGNRLLSKFLVTIDYGQREVGLWRDPRTGL